MDSTSAMPSATQTAAEMAVRRDVQSRDVRISIVIPAYNEARNLPHVLARIPNWANEVILVDGHSTDGTQDIAKHLIPTIKIIQQSGKGKGNALRCGVAASTGNVIVMMDADGSTDPGELPRFVAALLAGADVAKGSRYIGDGGSGDLTRVRQLGNLLLSYLTNWLFGLRFTDLCYGYNALWKDCFEFFELDCDGFEVETLLSLRAWKANLKIVEIPSYEHPRLYGTSHLRTFRDGWRVLMVILKERANGRSTIRAAGMHRCRQETSMAFEPQAIKQQIGAIG